MISQSEVAENIYSCLKEFGLTEAEANLYVTSLTMGPKSISALATAIGAARPNLYKLIAGLEEKGLAKFSERKRYAHTFVVEPPTVVLEKLREKRASFENLDHNLVGMMPDLLAHYHQGEALTKVRIYKGKEQWLKIFFEILDEAGKDIKYFGSADAFIELIGWKEENQWIKGRLERGIHIDCLLTPGEDADTLQDNDPLEMRETRYFRGTMPFVTGFMLYANKVIIWQPKAPLVVLMEDEYVVQMLQSIFHNLWEIAGKK